MQLVLETLALGPPQGAVEEAWQQVLEEQLRMGLDPSGAMLGGVTRPAESRLDALQKRAFQLWIAAEPSLAPAEQRRLERWSALALAPVWVSNARRQPGAELIRPEPSFPLPNLLAAPEPELVTLGLRLAARVLWAAGVVAEAREALEAAAARSRAHGHRRDEGLALLILGEIAAAPDAPLLSLQRWLHEGERGALDIPGTVIMTAAGQDPEPWWSRAEPLLAEDGPARACLSLVRGLVAAREGRAEAGALLAEAEKISEKEIFFWGAASAALHRALLAVGAGAPVEAGLAERIGARGLAADRPGFTLGLAQVALVWAWRALDERGEAQQAARAAALAVGILEAQGAAYAAGHALVAQARLAGLGVGPEAALPPLQAAWDRALSLEGGALELPGFQLALGAAVSALQAAMGTRDPAAIRASIPRLERLSARGAQLGLGALPLGELLVPGLQAALIEASNAAEEGDRAGLSCALRDLERQLPALDEPGRWLWASTLAAWQERPAEAAALWLRYQQATEGVEPSLGEVPPEFYATEQALRRQRQRDRAVEGLAMFVACEQWEQAEAALAALEAAPAEGGWGVEGWLDPACPWEGLCTRAEVLDGAGRLDAAALAWERAADAVDARRARLSGDAGRSALAGDRVVHAIGRGGARTALRRRALALERGDVDAARALMDQAFRFGERVRARSLADLLSVGRSPLRSSAPEELQRWQAARARLGALMELLGPVTDEARRQSLQAKIQALSVEVDALEAALAAAWPGLGRLLRPEAELVGLDALPGLLPPGGLFLAWDVYDRGLVLWAVPRGGPPLVHRQPLERLRLPELARVFAERCAGGLDEAPAGEALAELLLEPAAALINQAERLILAPSGPLHRVPFAALPWRGERLGAARVLSVVPGASALPWLRRDQPLGGLDRAVVVGNPAEMSWSPVGGGAPLSLPALPGAAAEARSVAARLDAPTLLLGEAASLDAVLAALPGARLLHLATHGRFEPAAPLLSAVTLARGEVLDVATLYRTRLQAELVVLSACETGLSRGGERHGLSRGLLAAGAGSVLLSLWPVDDRATRDLMVALYEGLAAGQTPAFALQQAQLTLQKMSSEDVLSNDRDVFFDAEERPSSARHPRLWAAFVLIG